MEAARGGSNADEHDDAGTALRGADQEYGRALGRYANHVTFWNPHLRVADSVRERAHRPVIAYSLIAELERDQGSHPLVTAGFAGSDHQSLITTCNAVSLAIGSQGHEAAFRSSEGQSGAIPSFFWLDQPESAS